MFRSLSLLLCVFMPGAVWAHGGASIEEDSCVRQAGPYLIHFTVYQPQVNPAQEYCKDVPEAGQAILVFDFVNRALRDIPTALRVIQKLDGTEPRTVLHIPAQTYSTGVMHAEATFDTPGEYLALVSFDGEIRSQFPIRVGAQGYGLFFLPLGIVGLGIGLYFWGRAPKS